MLGEHIVPQSEVIRAILLEDSPCMQEREDHCFTGELPSAQWGLEPSMQGGAKPSWQDIGAPVLGHGSMPANTTHDAAMSRQES